MFDINKYDITEAELNEYLDSLVVYIGVWTCEKWDGKSFNGVSPALIKKHHGEDFYVYRKDGIYQFISKENNLSEITSNIIDVEINRLCEEHFADKLFPVDEHGNPIKPIKIPEQELIQAEMLLNQCSILINQENQDAVLAEILINQLGV